MEPFVFSLPVKIVFGPGTLELLAEECGRLFRHPALVTGMATLSQSGLKKQIEDALGAAGIVPVSLPGVPPNPTCEECDDLAARARSAGADGVLAIGGGSVMDAGKAVAMLLAASPPTCAPDPLPCAHYLREWEGECPPVPGRVPLALVPTTFGTGSEGNSGMVLTDGERSHKLTFFHPALSADLALIDPQLTASVPLRAMRRGLFDAFCHVADAYLTAKGEFLASERIAEAIMVRICELAEDLACDSARAELAHLSLLALSGLPDAGRSGAYPLHDLASPVTARLGVPHGEALALLFPALATFSATNTTARARMERLHRLLDPPGSSSDFPSFLRAFTARLDLCTSLAPDVSEHASRSVSPDLCFTMAADCVTLFGGGGMTVENSVPLHLHEMAEIYREVFPA